MNHNPAAADYGDDIIAEYAARYSLALLKYDDIEEIKVRPLGVSEVLLRLGNSEKALNVIKRCIEILEAPLEDIPLYINDEELSIRELAKWRMENTGAFKRDD